MIDAVIIGQNEGKSVPNMYEELKKYDFINRIWVVDRSTDDTVKQLEALGECYIKTPSSLQGRQTSHCRNLGCRLTDPTHDVLFLDGDRYPTNDISSLKNAEKDITLLQIEKEERNKVPNYYWEQVNYGHVCNHFFSCGLLIKREALNKIMEFQHGQVFDEELQGLWGVEDTYLGDVCYHLGLSAELDEKIRLHGIFETSDFQNFDALRMRFIKRDKLNVIW